jgi:hypothetical protein
VDLPLFLLSTVSIGMFYVQAHREALGSIKGVLRWIPFLMAVGIGLSINNARAVLEALRGKVSGFRRTPKYNLAGGETVASRRYRIRINRDTWIELGLAGYFLAAIAAAMTANLWAAVPFLLLFGTGYAYTAGSTLIQSWRSRPGS